MGCKQMKDKDDNKSPEKGKESNANENENEVKDIDIDKDKNKENENEQQENKEQKEGEEPQKKEVEAEVPKEEENKDKEVKPEEPCLAFSESQSANSHNNEIYKVKIIENNQTIWEKSFSSVTFIFQIILQFKSQNAAFNIDNEKTKWLTSNKTEIDTQKTIKDIKEFASEDKVIELYPINLSPSGKLSDLSMDIWANMKVGTDYVAKPHLNPFGLILFNKNKKGLDYKSFSQATIDQHELTLFSNTSSYCNGNNFLYMSGGERDGTITDNFWTIDLSNLHITKSSKQLGLKKNHSMIYVPNSYVFIVGGNSKTVLYYNTKTDTINEWGTMNNTRNEPSLALIDNRWLYAVSYMKNDLSFEKSDLRSDEEAQWEFFAPKINTSIQFSQKFFGIIHTSKDNLLFFGGCMMNDYNKETKCFEYHSQENELKESIVPFQECDLIEKTFLHVNEKWACLIPTSSLSEMNIILFNIEQMQSETIHFKIEDGKTDKTGTAFQSNRLSVPQLNLNMPNGMFQAKTDNI